MQDSCCCIVVGASVVVVVVVGNCSSLPEFVATGAVVVTTGASVDTGAEVATTGASVATGAEVVTIASVARGSCCYYWLLGHYRC